MDMHRSRPQICNVVLAVIAFAALAAGCSSGSGHHASSTSSPATWPAATSGRSTTTAANTADLASLKQQLDASGASLGAADSALAQTDPNQTKNSEGTMP